MGIRRIAAIALALALSAPAFAAEPVPGDSCPALNQILQTGGPETTGVRRVMRCNGSIWVQEMTIDATGKIGIATDIPASTLHVNGEAIVGYTGQACASAVTGALRYNSGTITVQFCNGTTWANIASSGAIGIDDLTDAVTQYASGGSMYLGSGVGVYSSGGGNTALGYNAFNANTAAQQSTAFGYEAMRYANSTG